MALNEFERPPDLISAGDLRQESVLKDLISEGRMPVMIRDSEDAVICFIPPQGLGQGQRLEFSLADAKEIATIRDKLSREV